MGEIGINRLEYLYELNNSDLLMIERGYNRRLQHPWGIARWETYHMLMAIGGSKWLNENGIHSPKDLLKFPWEDIYIPLTKEEQDELQNDMKYWESIQHVQATEG